LNLGFTPGEERARVEQNQRLFLARVGAEGFALVSLRQVHSSHAFQVTRTARGKLEYRPCGVSFPERHDETPPAGDALLTDEPGILLSVRSADCLPVLLVDPKRRAIGAIHAGWLGTLAGLIEKTVDEMRDLFGSEPPQLLAALGPSIRACCYEVGEEILEAFQERFPRAESFFCKPPNRPRFRALHLDLVAAAQDQLRNAGLNLRNVSVAGFCTACRTDLFFSHRKEGRRAGRCVAIIGIRPDARE
jgi:hypothetical protein